MQIYALHEGKAAKAAKAAAAKALRLESSGRACLGASSFCLLLRENRLREMVCLDLESRALKLIAPTASRDSNQPHWV